MSKIEDGNIRAAIRIITSGDTPAVDNVSTYQSLCDRHPHAPSDRNPSSDPSKFPTVQFTEEDVTAAIRSFPAGSAGGPDGVRPQHLRDLTSNKETGPALISALTAFINLLMQGKCPSSITPIFFGGRLIALQKKSGGIRPIAIGYTLRRLAAKCVNKFALTVLKGSFTPAQLGEMHPVAVRQPSTPPAAFLPTCLTTMSLLRLISPMHSIVSAEIQSWQQCRHLYQRYIVSVV